MSVAPIRSDIVPATDGEREMIDYAAHRVRRHVETYGEPPMSVAIVTESSRGRVVHSFSLDPDSDRLRTCSSAAALLLHRATDDAA